MNVCVARDEAFNFTYRANLDSLARLGQITFFPPLRDRRLPSCSLLYLPGGYPEFFAKELAVNDSMRTSILDYALSGGRVYAECGGFMYLCQELDSMPMCGVLPLQATMQDAHLHLGYRQMEWLGQQLRGHEFHYSTVYPSALSSDVTALVLQQTASGQPVDTPLYLFRRVIAGYTHWYWADGNIPFPFFPDLLV